ncbi:nucleotidyl transferase AbiEii/AbiGii toxin family protein [Candidatus Woesearchaeota archaeon]|nr:nucleotidyl transferase AbiEii/AbiGii toxin family protein [Candidatus Woesearchaeota archaeon]
MVEIPLILKLKKQMHKDIATAQDIIVTELYNVFGDAVLHGGTAVWRCYDGNRFSEDVDVYIQRDIKKIDALFKIFEKNGFAIVKKKISETSLFSTLELNRTVVRLEAVFKKKAPRAVLKEYKKCDGNLITVYTLAPEDLIREKVEAYIHRQKVRDIYDIFFLLRKVSDKTAVSKELEKLIRPFKKPADEKELQVLIIEGIVPQLEQMMEYIKMGAP